MHLINFLIKLYVENLTKGICIALLNCKPWPRFEDNDRVTGAHGYRRSEAP